MKKHLTKMVACILVMVMTICLAATPAFARKLAFTGETQTISVGGNTAFAVDSKGTLWGWGFNEANLDVLGNGGTGNEKRPEEEGITSTLAYYQTVPIKIMEDIKYVNTNSSTTYAIDKNGTLWGWGSGVSHLESPDGLHYRIAENVVSASDNMFMTEDGTLWSFGSNTWGELGIGSTETYSKKGNKSAPVKVMSNVTSFIGGSTCFAVDKDGVLWGWGKNDKDQLMNGGKGNYARGSDTIQTYPIKIRENVRYYDGQRFLLDTDGVLWAKGENGYGQLGTGDREDTDTFQQVQFTGDIKKTAVGYNHSLILTTDGTLYGFGLNAYGQLGNGRQGRPLTAYYNDYRVHYKVPEKLMTGVVDVEAGPSFTMILKDDGTVWTCGQNSYGELGNGRVGDILSKKSNLGMKAQFPIQEYFIKIFDNMLLPEKTSVAIQKSTVSTVK